MSNEKITEILDRCKGRFGWVQININTADNYLLMPLTELVEILEKQIPKKPDYKGDEYVNGELIYDTWICPSCGRYYDIDYNDDYIYCPICGQRINWEEENEA